jgi:hypothetical protein
MMDRLQALRVAYDALLEVYEGMEVPRLPGMRMDEYDDRAGELRSAMDVIDEMVEEIS